MSKFFMVTLDNVSLDDNVTNDHTGWTSEKILKEIYDHRITKFEELEDVDVSNKEDKQMVIYSSDTKKFTTITPSKMGDAMGLSLNQVNKTGIVATPSAPITVDVPINTVDFKVPRVNVLKFIPGISDIVSTKNTFSSSEISDFKNDNMIVFDNTAHLKTNVQDQFVLDESLNNTTKYNVYKATVPGEFKSISGVASLISGTDTILSVTGVAKDRLLMQSNDINLSNASNIDKFTLTASAGTNGVGGVMVICSPDGGATWKTFDTNTTLWIDIIPTIDNVASKGINVDTFNTISSRSWNLLAVSHSLRFIYLLRDSNSIDQLSLQYDGVGHWSQAKDTEFDVNYSSNTLLQVKLYISGDIKINY